ncbi:hypothetical protein BDZ45DRAFT_595215 [Acephala macrosclerotiorum]|nr:hypothetical protein BDZ45DRAFT_595215 [Acephala macrosclerotiorum]
MAFGGLALKSVSWFLRIVEFCCAAIILGIFSYFLATLHNHDLHIATYIRAVEGISGAAVLYTIFALLLVCCLGGIAFFSVIGMLLDLAFTGAFIYVAWATRGGAHSCRGYVNTPFGSGNTEISNTVAQGSSGFTRLPSLHTACQLEKACFAVAIVGLVFFFFSIFAELGLIRHRKKERAFGPSPNNGYTAGSPKRKFWQRKPKYANRDLEKNPDALPTHATPADVRTSYATDATAVGNETSYNKYGNTPAYGNRTAGTVPSAGVNGYQTTTTTHVPHDGYTRTYQPYNANPTANF